MYLIDSNSLINICHYYAPFDDDQQIFYQKINLLFNNNSLLLTEAVRDEVENSKYPIVPDTFDFFSTINVLKNIRPSNNSDTKLLNRIKSTWVGSQGKNLDIRNLDIELEKEFNKGDFQLLFHALKPNPKRTIVTDESAGGGNRKSFKKLPILCRQERIRCINTTNFLREVGMKIVYHFDSINYNPSR